VGEVELPVVYRDASAVYAFFRLDLDRAAEVLAGTPLTPAPFARGTALAVVAAYDYRDTSVGPYREVGSALAVVPRGVAIPTLPLFHLLRAPVRGDLGWHVLDLPVTGELANVGGRELWGFPKFTTSIDVRVTEGALRVVVEAPTGEEPILTLAGRAGPGLPLGAPDLVFYTVRSGALLRTLVEARGRFHTGLGRWITLEVGGQEHPMARRLAALGLHGARPSAVQVCRRYQAILHAGVPFETAAARAA
jgi:hypothetical protein